MPGQPSVRDAEQAADVECRGHYKPALDAFTHVPEKKAEREIGPFLDPLAKQKREAMILAKEIGKLQTGFRVDAAWAFACLTMLAEEALGEVGWSIMNESSLEAVEMVSQAAKEQIRIANEKGIAQQGTPF